MSAASRPRLRAAVLAGAAAVAVLATGACNDESPADSPGSEQDGGGSGGDGGGY